MSVELSESDDERLQRHYREVKDYVVSRFEHTIFKVKSVETQLYHASCKLMIVSYDESITGHFNETPVIELLEKEPFSHFSIEQNFDDPDGEYFCSVTVWDNPSFEIENGHRGYPIQKLMVVDFIERGQLFEYEVIILI